MKLLYFFLILVIFGISHTHSFDGSSLKTLDIFLSLSFSKKSSESNNKINSPLECLNKFLIILNWFSSVVENFLSTLYNLIFSKESGSWMT